MHRVLRKEEELKEFNYVLRVGQSKQKRIEEPLNLFLHDYASFERDLKNEYFVENKHIDQEEYQDFLIRLKKSYDIFNFSWPSKKETNTSLIKPNKCLDRKSLWERKYNPDEITLPVQMVEMNIQDGKITKKRSRSTPLNKTMNDILFSLLQRCWSRAVHIASNEILFQYNVNNNKDDHKEPGVLENPVHSTKICEEEAYNQIQELQKRKKDLISSILQKEVTLSLPILLKTLLSDEPMCDWKKLFLLCSHLTKNLEQDKNNYPKDSSDINDCHRLPVKTETLSRIANRLLFRYIANHRDDSSKDSESNEEMKNT